LRTVSFHRKERQVIEEHLALLKFFPATENLFSNTAYRTNICAGIP